MLFGMYMLTQLPPGFMGKGLSRSKPSDHFDSAASSQNTFYHLNNHETTIVLQVKYKHYILHNSPLAATPAGAESLKQRRKH